MRSRIHNILLLAGMLLTIAVTTSCVYNTPGGDEELTLLIKLSPTIPFRTIEVGAHQDTYTVGNFQPIILFFYDEEGNPTEPYRVELKSADDIALAMDTGYEMKVRQSVAQVSAVAGRSGVLKPDSYVASPCELPIRYIEDFTIRGIYLNNYKETVGATSRNFLASDKYDTTGKVWTGHRTEMHTLFGALNEANNYAKTMTAGKVDAYQIYPGKDTDPEALDHIIVEVEYTLHTRVGYFDAMVYNKDKSDYVYACSRVETKPVQKLRRFITIRKFLVSKGTKDESLVAFDAGKIYRINLNYLSPLFSMNTNPGIEKTDDITEITPRRERTDELPEETTAAVLVDVSGWTHINIDTELE